MSSVATAGSRCHGDCCSSRSVCEWRAGRVLETESQLTTQCWMTRTSLVLYGCKEVNLITIWLIIHIIVIYHVIIWQYETNIAFTSLHSSWIHLHVDCVGFNVWPLNSRLSVYHCPTLCFTYFNVELTRRSGLDLFIIYLFIKRSSYKCKMFTTQWECKIQILQYQNVH